MKNVYFFSGLGADERVFRYLDLSFCNPVFINWNLPQNNESIENFALRLSEQINEKNPILIGVSFGGMIAVEVAKIIQTEKVILISSAKTKFEIPLYYRFAGKINAHKIMPVVFLQKIKSINNFLFGVSSNEEKELLNKIITETNPYFLKWAMGKIVHWENEFIPDNLIHIHGTKDKILPCRFVKPDYSIGGAGHFMVVQQARQMSIIISNNL
ncbi:MAG: alpha/beta hydrolase [Chitinophagales bacterium]|nr:alpha/beta hydrolase [Chitinophagales bacterium]